MVTKKQPVKTAARGKQQSLDLKEMQRVVSDSRPNRIAALEVGQSESAVIRLSLEEAVDVDVQATINDLKSTMSKAAVRAAERTGYTYMTESGTTLTSTGGIIVFSVVTRTA